MTGRGEEARAISLLSSVYDAAKHPERWTGFVQALSVELGDAAVMLNIELPNTPESATSHRVHSDPEFGIIFAELAAMGAVPWPLGEMAKTPRFFWAREFIDDEDLEKTEFYGRFMQPQGFVTDGVIGHVMAAEDGRPIAAIGAYRRKGGRPLTDADAALLDLLVPHLRNAYEIHCELRAARRRHDVIAETVDRFPIGVIFFDGDLRVVDANRAATRIAADRDGVSIDDGVVAAAARVAEGGLAAIARSVDPSVEPTIARGIFAIDRPSGRRPYEAFVTMLPGARPHDAVAALFIADPEDRQVRMPDVFSVVYKLTDAETELAMLLCSAKSIEEAATIRGISLHTARSQLKKIFTKTGVNRQVDLVRLLTAGVSGLESPSGRRGGLEPTGTGGSS